MHASFCLFFCSLSYITYKIFACSCHFWRYFGESYFSLFCFLSFPSFYLFLLLQISVWLILKPDTILAGFVLPHEEKLQKQWFLVDLNFSTQIFFLRQIWIRCSCVLPVSCLLAFKDFFLGFDICFIRIYKPEQQRVCGRTSNHELRICNNVQNTRLTIQILGETAHPVAVSLQMQFCFWIQTYLWTVLLFLMLYEGCNLKVLLLCDPVCCFLHELIVSCYVFNYHLIHKFFSNHFMMPLFFC